MYTTYMVMNSTRICNSSQDRRNNVPTFLSECNISPNLNRAIELLLNDLPSTGLLREFAQKIIEGKSYTGISPHLSGELFEEIAQNMEKNFADPEAVKELSDLSFRVID